MQEEIAKKYPEEEGYSTTVSYENGKKIAKVYYTGIVWYEDVTCSAHCTIQVDEIVEADDQNSNN